jgi:hypothetical protein
MKRLGLAIMLFAALGLAAVATFALSALTTQESRFETYDALVASGLVERGWVPAGLPRSVRSINEYHDVSANSARASFQYDPKDMQTTRQTCKALIETERGATFLCPPFDGQVFIVVLKTDGRGTWELVNAV